MPTASDYVTGASVFRRLATTTNEQAQWLAYSLPEEAIGPCPVRSTLDKDLGVSLRNLVDSANEFSALATTCTRRAVICTEFDADVRIYEIELRDWEAVPDGQRGPRPAEPSPPYSWVERSR